MSSILTLIPVAVATSLLAEGAYEEAKLKNHISRSLKMTAVLLVPAIIIVWFLSNKVLLLYGGLYAKNGTTLLHWLAIASVPLAINTIYFSIKRVQKNVKPFILLASFMAIIVVVMSYLLLPRMGINGVGIAWLAGQSVIAFIVIIWDMRHLI
jgi:O-antigen/teichoic acid export membrane protein